MRMSCSQNSRKLLGMLIVRIEKFDGQVRLAQKRSVRCTLCIRGTLFSRGVLLAPAELLYNDLCFSGTSRFPRVSGRISL
jgi:hypothetical protein